MDEIMKNSVLVVDDQNSNIVALTRILSPEYTVYAAKNGPDAIELANNQVPDIILLDIIMSGMDGYEVIAALKKSEKTRTIPVIFVSGLDDAESEERGLLAGAADYINKPFRAMTVSLRVRNQMQILNYFRRIEQMSMTDQLTSLPNRRSFDERLRLEWNRAIRDKAPISICMIDLDKFKLYNDTHGHQQGDVALKTMAKVFTRELKRSVDYVARWGGEEFVVLLTNTDSGSAMIVAERLRASAEKTRIECKDGKGAEITVSIGVSTLIPTIESSADDFLRHADEALYTAKNSGRNKVCHNDIP